MSTEIEITKALAGLAEYYGKQVPEIAVNVMVRNLSRFDIEDVRRAINSHIEDPDRGRFMPLLADLMAHLKGTDDERARRAWDFAIAAAARVGAWSAVQFEDQTIGHVIRTMGGWPRFCAITNDERPFRQKEFIERYATDVRVPPPDMPVSLTGLNTDERLTWLGTSPQPAALPAPAMDESKAVRLQGLLRSPNALPEPVA